MDGRDEDEFVAVAEVVRAVGLHGEFRLQPLHDWYAPLLGSPYLRWLDGAPFAATGARPDGEGAVVRTADCLDRVAAEARVGRAIGFLRSSYAEPAFPKPPEGLPFRFLGRPVVTAGGAAVGTVAETRRYAGRLVLVIERRGREVLVPAVAPILRPDDGLVGPLVIDPPPGLIDDAEASVIDDRRD